MDESSLRTSLGPDFVAYLSKPIDLDTFEEIVATICRRIAGNAASETSNAHYDNT